MSEAFNGESIRWQGDRLTLLDQRLLPEQLVWVPCQTAEQVAAAIHSMVVRGAPAIGICAAWGLVLAARQWLETPANRVAPAEQAPPAEGLALAMRQARGRLAASRPTAVNLFWALGQMDPAVNELVRARNPAERRLAVTRMEETAAAIHAADIQINRSLAAFGAALIGNGRPITVMTHCNTGSLATGGYGTAIGVIRRAWENGRISRVFACETRPWMQGARLTAWELQQAGIPVSVIVDSAASYILRTENVQWVITGADRVAANGDTANKIGTCNLAILARHYGAGFMVAAPLSTIDWGISSGEAIPVEERAGTEIASIGGRRMVPEGVDIRNPVFDITPASLITALVTEGGTITRPDQHRMRQLLQGVHGERALDPCQ